MEDGGVDRTVIDCRQNQLGQMADFLPLLTFKIFDLVYLKCNLRPCGTQIHTGSPLTFTVSTNSNCTNFNTIGTKLVLVEFRLCTQPVRISHPQKLY